MKNVKEREMGQYNKKKRHIGLCKEYHKPIDPVKTLENSS